MTDERPNTASDPRQGLSAAVDVLYAAFARYKFHHPLTGCPHCTSADDDRLVRSKPLHQLEPACLERFAFKALTTLGTLEDLKHFLPRMLELAGRDGDVGGTPFEVVLGKLDYGKWGSWPQREREAVRAYLTALWDHVLGTFPCPLEADTCLCGIGQAEDDLLPYLSRWRANESEAAVRHLAEFIDGNSHRLLKSGRLANAFWQGRDDQMRQVMDWLLDPATGQRLERAFFRFGDAEVAGELSQAVERLDWVRQQGKGTS